MANKDKTINQLSQADSIDGNEMIPFAKNKANGKISIRSLFERIFSDDNIATFDKAGLLSADDKKYLYNIRTAWDGAIVHLSVEPYEADIEGVEGVYDLIIRTVSVNNDLAQYDDFSIRIPEVNPRGPKPHHGLMSINDKRKLDSISEESWEIPSKYEYLSSLRISPNVLHVWGEMAELTLTLAEGKEGVVNEYMIEFVSGETPTRLSLPAEVQFPYDPEIEANRRYQISIVNNFGVMQSVEA